MPSPALPSRNNLDKNLILHEIAKQLHAMGGGSGVDAPAPIGDNGPNREELILWNILQHIHVLADGGIGASFAFEIPAGANGSVSITLASGFRVVSVRGYVKGAGTAGSAVQVLVDTDAVTESIDLSAASDTDAFAAESIDDAENDGKAGDVLAVSYESTGGDFPGAFVVVEGVRI